MDLIKKLKDLEFSKKLNIGDMHCHVTHTWVAAAAPPVIE